MRKSFDLFFASSNKNKYSEAKLILEPFGIDLQFFKSCLEEPQSDSLLTIASKKAKDAYSKLQKPVIVEDDGLFVESLKGFPGPYSSYVFQTLGNDGILNLLKKNRKAKFVSVIAFYDGNVLRTFDAKLDGTISDSQHGKGWGYDPIFIPKNFTRTFAELNEKNNLSHRYKALKKFSSWYQNTLGSSDQ